MGGHHILFSITPMGRPCSLRMRCAPRGRIDRAKATAALRTASSLRVRYPFVLSRLWRRVIQLPASSGTRRVIPWPFLAPVARRFPRVLCASCLLYDILAAPAQPPADLRAPPCIAGYSPCAVTRPACRVSGHRILRPPSGWAGPKKGCKQLACDCHVSLLRCPIQMQAQAQTQT